MNCMLKKLFFCFVDLVLLFVRPIHLCFLLLSLLKGPITNRKPFEYLFTCGALGPVVARLTEDWEVPGSNPTLAKHEFLWAQKMNLLGSILPQCELVSWDGGSVQVWYSWAPYFGCTQNQECNSFPRETRILMYSNYQGKLNVKVWLNSLKRPNQNW